MPNVFFDRIRYRLRNIIRRKRRNYNSSRFDTSDVLQESLLQILHEVPEEGKDSEEVSQSLLNRIANGHLAKQLRHHYAKKRSVLREDSAAEPDSSAFTNEDDPQLKTLHAETVERLFNSMAQLSELQQKVVHLRFFEGLTYEQIAVCLSIKSHVVRVQLAKALKFLNQQLEEPE